MTAPQSPSPEPGRPEPGDDPPATGPAAPASTGSAGAPLLAAAQAPHPRPRVLQLQGLLLFLFIPAVLFLFVVHPEPVGASLAAGVLLMLGHRFLALPYARRARHAKCLWCNRVPPRPTAGGVAASGAEPGGPAAAPPMPAPETLLLETAAGPLGARCCAGHSQPVARYFAFLWTWRHLLRAGIFLPLLLLLASLAVAALGAPAAQGALPLSRSVDIFRLGVGLTVNLAAWGYLVTPPRRPARVPFPVHNFFLLGLWPLLWIFRLVGAWWIWKGASGLASVFAPGA